MKKFVSYKIVFLVLSLFLSAGGVYASSCADELEDGTYDKSVYKCSLELKLKLFFKGVTYTPWEDRLDNDIILMSRILETIDAGVGDYQFGDYQIISTKARRSFRNNKKRLLYVSYTSSIEELRDLLFTHKQFVEKKEPIQQLKKPVKEKIPTQQQQKQKTREVRSYKVEITGTGVVKDVVPIKEETRNIYTPKGINLVPR